MTREEVTKEAINKIQNTQVSILQLATGFGKSKLAIECINTLSDLQFKLSEEGLSVNIVVPTRALITNWQKELDKWDCKTDLIDIKCYNSLAKMSPYADLLILDEAHHLSEAKQQVVLDMLKVNPTMKIIALSATLDKDNITFLKSLGTYNYIKCTTVDAINDNVLPDPMIYLIPMELDNRVNNSQIIINPKKLDTTICSYNNMWPYKKRYPNKRIIVNCTQRQYYQDIDNKVEFYKKKFMVTRSEIMKNRWLRTAKDRLEWLAIQKNNMVNRITNRFDDQRYVIFCANIKQSELLCNQSITSKSNAMTILNKFNNKKINHISSCIILNEGHNLVDCRMGIFANLNGSEKLGIQRIGRTLRHEKPILIVPFFKNTRDEEIVKKMFVGYNKERIICTANLNEIRL